MKPPPKALSLLQPWATLLAEGHKRIETRSWNSKYRGPLLIAASKGKDKHGEALWNSEPCDAIRRGRKYEDLPFGAIIGRADLQDTMQFGDDKSCDYFNKLGRADNKAALQEFAFGDFTEGRWGLLMKDAFVFKTPIPASGALGLWDPLKASALEIKATIASKDGLITPMPYVLTYYGECLDSAMKEGPLEDQKEDICETIGKENGRRILQNHNRFLYDEILLIEDRLFRAFVPCEGQIRASMNVG